MGYYVERRSGEEIGRKRRKVRYLLELWRAPPVSTSSRSSTADIEGNCIQQRHRSSSSVVPPVTIPLGLSYGAALCVALQGRPELNLNSLRSRTIPTEDSH
jgi:hypothetical protein